LAAERAPGVSLSPTSNWSSEESREFLQERISSFARLVFLITVAFFVCGWVIALFWTPSELSGGLPAAMTHVIHLGAAAVLLAMWLSTRRGVLPASVLRVIDAGGTFVVAVLFSGMSFRLPLELVLRPDLLAVLSVAVVLLYRSAIVPSAPRTTAVIGALAAAPLLPMTYLAFAGGGPTLGAPSPWAYVTYTGLFGSLAVLLSTAISRIIYGLRQTVREARRLGPYTLVQKIGEGGMGAVYRAEHALLRRPTAIKILPPERAGEMDLARFEREVQMTSLLTSPHTVSVYDFGRTPDGLFYYAMEYLDGIDLLELVRRDGPMPAGRVVHVLRQVCEALGEAHRVGLIHRDIKPANILLCERGGRPDVAKVVDFGLVKSLAGSAGAGVTRENTVLGTPHYMAPESLRSPDRVDARSDIYALGATAYFLLTGKPVFDGAVPEVFAGHLRGDPVPPSTRLGRAVPSSLEALIVSALAKTPGERPQTAEAFAAALAACRDVPPWTEAHAAAWWQGRGATIRAARSGAPDSEAPTTPGTLAIARAAAGPEAGGN
jgi:eukaryotic-like serine/threonine-protein kinase